MRPDPHDCVCGIRGIAGADHDLDSPHFGHGKSDRRRGRSRPQDGDPLAPQLPLGQCCHGARDIRVVSMSAARSKITVFAAPERLAQSSTSVSSDMTVRFNGIVNDSPAKAH
ncbi:MAG: hypothetical protein R2709_04050 [Marmoricola sp.]